MAEPHDERAPTISALSARVRAVGVWALATIATAVPVAVAVGLAVIRTHEDVLELIGYTLLGALALAPFAGLVWAVPVAVCAFVGTRRHRAGARASAVRDAAIGAGAAMAIGIPYSMFGAFACGMQPSTAVDRASSLMAAAATAWMLLLGAFIGWRLGVIARRRAGASSTAATSPSQPSG